MIFAIVGSSGAGKDKLIRGALAARPDLRLVRRVITRPTNAGGEDFNGVSAQDFQRRSDTGAFALHWDAHGLSYGIPKAKIDGPGDVLFNGSRATLPDAARVFPGLRVILITAPIAVLAERLAQRGRESASDIQARLSRAGFEMPKGIDHQTVVNDGSPSLASPGSWPRFSRSAHDGAEDGTGPPHPRRTGTGPRSRRAGAGPA